MADEWSIRGVQFSNCNCIWACPCQFQHPTTYGHCEAIVAGHVEEGNFNGTSLNGLDYALLIHWPGEIAAGNGSEQVIIDDSADDAQREALKTIVYGGATKPLATHFFVYNSTCSEVLDPVYAPIDMSIDVKQRKASINVKDYVESSGLPIISNFTGEPYSVRINLPDGFEYTFADIGKGKTKTLAKAGVSLQIEADDSYGQFCELHMNQDGVIR
ncbi:MAG TPA: DUF1326 domain-containing protein [Actinomycetota bacterium]|jgi:hypothetical protein|nr:DUF1326 domain-containing protein [Actinomycetota bacterium]